MRRRQKRDDSSSLELLLDTICNTFGGILFISLLVAILLNTTSKQAADSAPEQVSQLELMESELQRRDLASELAKLQLAVGQLEVNSQTIATPEIVELAKKLHQAEMDHTQAVAENSQTQGTLNQTQIAINEIAINSEQRTQEIAAARRKAAALEDRLKESIAQRSGEAVIPKVTESDLQPVIFLMRHGRLYGAWPGPDLTGTDVGGGRTQIDVVAGAGVAIDPNGETSVFKKSFSSAVSASRHRVVICVWPDSYEHWTLVRRCLSEMQLKYQLFPLAEDAVLIIGEGGGENTVQG